MNGAIERLHYDGERNAYKGNWIRLTKCGNYTQLWFKVEHCMKV